MLAIPSLPVDPSSISWELDADHIVSFRILHLRLQLLNCVNDSCEKR